MTVFGIVIPPATEKQDEIKIADPKNPSVFCTAKIIERLRFDITGSLNYFPDWLSLVLFGIEAEPVLSNILKKYPEAGKQNQFEIWIVAKTKQ
jgi:hypothetical protein